MAIKKNNGTGKKRTQKSWKSKITGRVEKVLKTLTRLNLEISAAKAPGVEATHVSSAKTHTEALSAQLNQLDNSWKPARGNKPGTSKKIGVGSLVCVRKDLNRDEVKLFKHIKAELFDNAVVLEDDGRDWLVKCQDDVTRVLRKKLAAKVPDAPVAEAA